MHKHICIHVYMCVLVLQQMSKNNEISRKRYNSVMQNSWLFLKHSPRGQCFTGPVVTREWRCWLWQSPGWAKFSRSWCVFSKSGPDFWLDRNVSGQRLRLWTFTTGFAQLYLTITENFEKGLYSFGCCTFATSLAVILKHWRAVVNWERLWDEDGNQRCEGSTVLGSLSFNKLTLVAFNITGKWRTPASVSM